MGWIAEVPDFSFHVKKYFFCQPCVHQLRCSCVCVCVFVCLCGGCVCLSQSLLPVTKQTFGERQV